MSHEASLAGWRGRWKAIGPDHDPLMMRFVILRTPWGHLYLHKFLRSDADRDLHDHPWAFATIPLWRGYVEEIPNDELRSHILSGKWLWGLNVVRYGATYYKTVKVRRWPLIPLFRSARWAHRVEVERGKPAWTLIWTARIDGRKEREWGFFTRCGWVPWRVYVDRRFEEDGIAV